MSNFAKLSSKLTACGLAFLLGASGVFAYAPFDFWGLAYLSAAGLLGCLLIPQRKTAIWAAFAWSIGYFCAGVNWIHVSMIQFGSVPEVVSYLAVFLLACYLAIYNVLFVWGAHRFQLSNPFALAALFTLTEYLRGVVFTGFPWLQFGYSQIDSPFAGIAPVLGVEGLTFFVMVTSGYILRLIDTFAKMKTVALPSVLALCLSVGLAFASQFMTFVQKSAEKSPLTVSLVQGNIEQQLKWDPAYFNQTIQTYYRLVAPLLGKSEVIVLPESAIPALEGQIQPVMQSFAQAGKEKGSEIIIGTLYEDQQAAVYNSAILLGNPQQPYAMWENPRYKKHHLVPFGEYVPFGSLLDWLREVFILPVNLSQGDFVQPAMIAKEKKLNLAICYEIIFGDQVQQNQAKQQSDYLLTITNDAWFGASIGPWQHFQMARMRALELGKPLLRAANTGITAVVDEKGKVSAQLPQFEEGVLTYAISTTEGETLFGRFGTNLIYGISLFCLALAFGRRAFTNKIAKN